MNVATPNLPTNNMVTVSYAQTYIPGTTTLTSYQQTLFENNVTTTNIGTYGTPGNKTTMNWDNYTSWVNYDGTSITSTW